MIRRRRGHRCSVVGNKVSHLFNTSPRCNYGSVISQIRVLASHTGSLALAQGPWKLEDLPMGRCLFFLVTLECLAISSKKVPIETFYISSQSTHNKQQAGIIIICTEERGKKL